MLIEVWKLFPVFWQLSHKNQILRKIIDKRYHYIYYSSQYIYIYIINKAIGEKRGYEINVADIVEI